MKWPGYKHAKSTSSQCLQVDGRGDCRVYGNSSHVLTTRWSCSSVNKAVYGRGSSKE